MASSVGHTLTGVVIYHLVRRCRPTSQSGWKALWPFVLLPNLPDIDFLISYLLYADHNILHGNFTHSLGFALLISIFVVPFRLFASATHTFLVSFALVGSHLLLDMTSGQLFTGGKGFGTMLFYPFSEQKIQFPLAIFWGPKRRTMEELFSIENILGVVWELLIFTPIISFLRRHPSKPLP